MANEMHMCSNIFIIHDQFKKILPKACKSNQTSHIFTGMSDMESEKLFRIIYFVSVS